MNYSEKIIVIRIARKEERVAADCHCKGRINRLFILFLASISVILFLCSNSVLGDISQNITINPVGDQKIGDKFEISGTTSLQNPAFVVMQINPKKEYEFIKKWISETRNPGFSFALEVDGEEDGTPGNITRFYENGTSESRTYPMPIDRAYPVVQVTAGSDGISTWSVTYDGLNFLGNAMKPGDYSVVIMGEDKNRSGVADTSFSLS